MPEQSALLTSIDDIILELSSVYSPGLADITIRNTLQNSACYSMDNWNRRAIDSIAAQIQRHKYISEKQGNLALKIIRRYRKQLSKNGHEVKDMIKDPHWKRPFRNVDYTKKIWLEDQTICIKFPYDNTIINHIKSHQKKYRGDVVYLFEEKIWTFDLLEDFFDPELFELFIDDGFKLDEDIDKLYKQCIKIQNNPTAYIPLLDYLNGQLVLLNCEDSLVDYFVEHVGLNGELNTIIDKCSDYGVKVALNARKEFIKQYGDINTQDIYFERCSQFDPQKVKIEELVNYIEVSGRTPVLVLTSYRLDDFMPNTDDPVLKARYASRETDFFYHVMSKKLNVINLSSVRHSANDPTGINPMDFDVIISTSFPSKWTPKIVITTHDYGSDIKEIDSVEKIVYYY